MSTVLLFVTAKLPVEVCSSIIALCHADRNQSVNRYLSQCQAITDLAENSFYALIRDKNVNIDDIDTPGTEPPVKGFTSGFIDASDDDLWRVLEGYDRLERERDSATYLDHRSIAVLDERAEKDETVKVLYKTEEGERVSWRVPYKFMPALHADLPDEEETYLKPEMVDSDGVLLLKKIKDDLGGVWEYE